MRWRQLGRSVGRIGWMQRHLPEAVHIVGLRNPCAQFASALRQFVLYGNAYFLAMPLHLLAMHRDLPAVSRLHTTSGHGTTLSTGKSFAASKTGGL
jgi:hypothetical protein